MYNPELRAHMAPVPLLHTLSIDNLHHFPLIRVHGAILVIPQYRHLKALYHQQSPLLNQRTVNNIYKILFMMYEEMQTATVQISFSFWNEIEEWKNNFPRIQYLKIVVFNENENYLSPCRPDSVRMCKSEYVKLIL